MSDDPRTIDGDPARVYVETDLPTDKPSLDDEPPYYLSAHESLSIETESGGTVYIEVLGEQTREGSD